MQVFWKIKRGGVVIVELTPPQVLIPSEGETTKQNCAVSGPQHLAVAKKRWNRVKTPQLLQEVPADAEDVENKRAFSR